MNNNNLLIENDSIHVHLLKSVISCAYKVNKFDWAEDKLSYYINYVYPAERNDIFDYNTGIIAFKKNDFITALKLLAQVGK